MAVDGSEGGVASLPGTAGCGEVNSVRVKVQGVAASTLSALPSPPT